MYSKLSSRFILRPTEYYRINFLLAKKFVLLAGCNYHKGWIGPTRVEQDTSQRFSTQLSRQTLIQFN